MDPYKAFHVSRPCCVFYIRGRLLSWPRSTMHGYYVCIYMCVCMYVCMYACMNVCTYVHACFVCMYVPVHACMYVCIYLSIYVCIEQLRFGSGIQGWRFIHVCTGAQGSKG